MFSDMGLVGTPDLSHSLLQASLTALAAELAAETYVGWLAVTGADRVVAGAGVHVKPQLPRISEDGSRVVTAPIPLVVNVYTEREWRKQGVARALMEALMEWASSRHFDRVVLHASDDGRPLYDSLGFMATNEMRWTPNKKG
jgi:GNAT superfamily N-acetyltransferase